MICKGSYLFVVLLCIQGQLFPVSGDFRVVDKSSKEIVFQTASDFVRTGCGSFLEKSYLIQSDPLNACDVPTGPPASLFSSQLSYLFGGSQVHGDYQWVLFAEDGGCDLKTKFRNAAAAGYSGIIVGTDERHEEITHPGLIDEDDEEFIDVHLVHSIDIRVLSKGFNGKSGDFVVEPPSLSRCKDEYHKTWLRSRYVSLVIRTWKTVMDVCYQCIMWTLVAFGKLAIGLKMIWPSVLYNRDTFSSIAFYLASIVISITILMIVSIQNNAKKLLKYKSFQKERKTSFTEPTTDSTKPKQPSNHTSYTPPPPPPKTPPPSPRPQQRSVLDYTLRHRINLNININEPLTKAKVNIAYRDMALKYHPDKNVHLNESQLAKITEEFRSKKKSRDILLLYCKE